MKKGIYQHYKGPQYEVLGEVLHTETREALVLYKALYEIKETEIGPNPLFVRPREMFLENVELDGILVPRFKYIG